MRDSALGRLKCVLFTGLALLFLPASAHALAQPRLKPPAPGPTYLSVNDRDRLLEAAGALKYKRFSDARMAVQSVSDPVARSLGEWMRLMAEDPTLSAAEADAFLDAHDDWPARRRMLSFVEKRLNDNVPAQTILDLFESREPVTGEGKVQLARALFAVGRREDGERYLRDAWVNHNFSLAEERRILKNYASRLTRADHAARVDRLLWARQVTNARRVFSRLSSTDRRMAEARAALLLGASTGPSLYQRLSRDEQLDPEMIHAAVRYYRRRGDEIRALSLAGEAPQDPDVWGDPARWWDERQLLMRWALREGRFADAYRAAAEHALKDGGDYAEAEFYAGWIALRFFNDADRAKTHFLALASGVGSPISRSRAYYWLGRAAMADNDATAAARYYAYAAEHYYSYYGQLAAEKIGGAATAQRFAPPAVSTPEDRALFSSRPTVTALRMLSDLNLDYEFMVFAYHVDDQLERPGEYVELAKLTNGEGAPHLTVRAGKVAVHRDAFTPDISYPLVFVPEEAKRFVEPAIILGLSRQESEFNPRAFSRAGARGVMQLIPSTAQITARKEGLSYSRSALLDDPIYNMTLGSAHLSHLLARYDGSLIMTLAAYNAGPHRVTRWVDEYGDPRSPGVDPIDWVEHIPFSETRNYVQRVLENVQVYRGRINEAAIPGRLAADLERGGPQNRIAADTAPSNVILVSGRPAASALPPPPARTVQKAQSYAQLITPTTPPAALQEAGAAPPETDEQAAPEQAPAQTQQDAANRSAAAPETFIAPPGQARPNQAPPNQAPIGLAPEQAAARNEIEEEITADEDAAAAPVAERADDAPVVARTSAAPTTVATPAGQEAVAADAPAPRPAEPSLSNDPSPAAPSLSTPSEAAPSENRVIKTAYDFLPPWPGTENATQNGTQGSTENAAQDETADATAQSGSDATGVDDPAAPLSALKGDADADLQNPDGAPDRIGAGQDAPETDPCLAYRDFLARNAEGELGAADLNASMLNELRAGRGCE